MENHFSRPPSIRCGDSSCQAVFTNVVDLCRHVHDDHQRDDVKLEQVRFGNFKEFEEWLKAVEVDTMSKFTKLGGSGKRTGRGTQQPHLYYQCHLSGAVERYQKASGGSLCRGRGFRRKWIGTARRL
ncbi:hypothetical protein L596_016601 [Steinernema carpocapsae]|uniref:C2H2-type domain-containing protein n=1 Tax=Steinernema carpocapsae TaxID=34508 RepID=A0A4U5NJC1_STECR|nr:hypothetical protein L596_016601 [Steinernema carpocapsae]